MQFTNLLRLSIFLFLAPRRFVQRDMAWFYIDIDEWHDEYEWSEDPFGGLLDYVQPVWTTYDSHSGDCEDYAVLMANYLYNETHRPISLFICGNGRRPRHVVASDGERIYSSGRIYEGMIDEYLEQSGFDWALERSVRG